MTGDDGRPEPGSDSASIRDDPQLLRGEVEVRDFALVTYLVPPERLQPHLPDAVELQTFRDGAGRRRAFLSASCFHNEDLRWAGGPSPHMTVHQSTYRTYVRHGDDVGAFFLASYVGNASGTLGQRLGLADTREAVFDVTVTRAPDGGYASYRAEMAADDGVAVLHAEAVEQPTAIAPFASAEEHVRFITHRLHGYAYSLAGVPVDAQVEHAEMAAFSGRLIEGRFPPLVRLELLPYEEQADPYSVLITPGATFQLLPPVPLT
jgi:hypothetical protein